ncbi:MAG: YhcH/YjgK/YiaL family protein [Coriobacteriia bacterium]
MIFDRIDRLTAYPNVPRAQRVAEYLAATDVASLTSGEHVIDGGDLFVRVLRYAPWEPGTNGFETHRRYADIQVVVSGAEIMRVVSAETLAPLKLWDDAGDCGFFACRAPERVSTILAEAGSFVVFFPGEAHEPGVRAEGLPGDVVKLVFKTKVA